MNILFLNVNECDDSCELGSPRFTNCRDTKKGGIGKVFMSCEDFRPPATNEEGEPIEYTGEEILALLTAGVNNVTPTEDDSSVIRELRFCAGKPLPNEEVQEKECGYPQIVTNRTHQLVGKILEHNKCNYEFLRGFQKTSKSVWIAYVTQSCEIFFVQTAASVIAANRVIAADDSTVEEWTMTFEWDSLTDPPCVDYPADWKEMLSPIADQCENPETIVFA